jgi:hypothetical protein
MNFKNLIRPMAAFALICGAPLVQAQVLGGGATGGLGGAVGGTLGGGMGSIGGNGQGNAGGTLGGTLDHGDTLRRHTRAQSTGRVKPAAGSAIVRRAHETR